jgi:hypothetical protein
MIYASTLSTLCVFCHFLVTPVRRRKPFLSSSNSSLRNSSESKNACKIKLGNIHEILWGLLLHEYSVQYKWRNVYIVHMHEKAWTSGICRFMSPHHQFQLNSISKYFDPNPSEEVWGLISILTTYLRLVCFIGCLCATNEELNFKFPESFSTNTNTSTTALWSK